MKVIELHKNNAKLIKRAQKHDREAQHLLYEIHSPKMLSVCRYYIKDLQQAEEAMLNGFYKMFNNINSYKGEGSFEGWLRRIMVRESITHLRSQKNLEFLTEEVPVFDEDYNSGPMNLGISDIQKLIDELPEGYKVVFVMYAIEGYKHNEIADILKISEGTSKSQLYKARKLLQEKLKTLKITSYGTH